MDVTLERVSALYSLVSQHAPGVERDRRLPSELLDALKAAGVFRMYVPRSHGGDELSPLAAIRVIEEISRADASTGWLSAIGANTPALFAGLPPEAYDAIYANGPDTIQAGSLIPRGRAVPVDGGFLFTGQWPYASGCLHADYLCFAALVDRGGGEATDGAPEIRMGVAPASQLEVLDTWHVSGLKGTGSHDIKADNLFVPLAWTSLFRVPPPVVRHPLDAVPPLGRLGLELTAVVLGTAQGALDDLIAVGRTKRPMGGMLKPLREDPTFQNKLGRLDLKMRAARTLLYDIASSDNARALRGEAMAQRTVLERIATLAFVGELSVEVVDGCFHASGVTGLFEQSPLQRRLRDAHAVVQHFLLSREPTPVGALLLGEPVSAQPF